MTSPRDLGGAALTAQVQASLAGAPSPRVREVLQALVAHLHAFATEVDLTEEEWFAAIDFLTRTGQLSDDERQEFVLLSDVLGLSMLVVGLGEERNAAAASGRAAATSPTESTVFGPFFVAGAPAVANGGDLAAGAPGEPCFVSGRVLDQDSRPVAGALVDVWQADEDGLYDVQYADLDAPRARGRLIADADGRFWFWTVRPEPYPIPTDGPVGALLQATARSPMRPAHIHFMVTADGFQPVITHIFAAGDPHLDSDAVFGVRNSLIAPFPLQPPGTAPDGSERTTPYHALTWDFVLRRTDDQAASPG